MLWFVGAAMVLVLLTAGLLYLALAHAMEWRDDQVLLKRASNVRELLQARRLDGDLLDHEVSEDLEGPRQLFMRISGPGAVGLHETPLMPESLAADRFKAPDGVVGYAVRYDKIADGNGHRFRTLTMITPSVAAGGGMVTIQMAVDTTLDAEVLNRYAEIIVLVVAAGLFLSLLSGWYIVRIQMRPLKQLAAETAKIQHSTLAYRVAADGFPTELAEFASQFNHMIARLEKAYEGLRRYADDVAHELRTPLNRIQLGAEVALNNTRTPEAYREALESTFDECVHLNAMVKSLLFMARAENGQAKLLSQPVNVARGLEKIRTFFESSACEAGVILTMDCDPVLCVTGDNTLFERAVSNLVANALAHTPRGGSISLMGAANDTGIVVEVADTGEGISPEHQAHVFDRFFRADAARCTDKDRVGLGLAITKTIVDLHRGRIALDSVPGCGTRFSLYFPAA
jgi:two-component system, OmpR family, heavy metal sensor histidine kinase CusS